MKIVLYVKPATKKNSSRIFRAKNGRPIIKPSAKYEQFERDCSLFLRPYINLGIDYPINLKCLVYVGKRYRYDLSNFIEAIQDCLVKYNVLADDNYNIVTGLDGSRVIYDKENPRIEIEITRL